MLFDFVHYNRAISGIGQFNLRHYLSPVHQRFSPLEIVKKKFSKKLYRYHRRIAYGPLNPHRYIHW